MAKVTIKGADKLAGDFLALERAERGPTLRKGSRAGAKVAQQAIKARAPKRLGKMVRGIVLRPQRSQLPSQQATTTVTLSKRTYSYEGKRKSAAMVGRMVELGTQNMAAQPFFRPGFDQAEEAIAAATEAEIARAIDLVLGGAR